MAYQIINSVNIAGQAVETIHRIADNTYIPKDPSNRDYQQYLEWVAEGNTIQPAE